MYSREPTWVRHNPNPYHRDDVPDCVIRAISIALGLSWFEVFDGLSATARAAGSVTCDDRVWGRYLFEKGFIPFVMPTDSPRDLTVRQFCRMFPHGTYIIGTGRHAVAVTDGDYHDSWDSGEMLLSFFWKIA